MLDTFCFASLALASSVHGHMELISPPDLGGKFNPNTGGNIDYTNTAPLAMDGSNFPCKGRLDLLGTPQGKTVAAWPAGSAQQMVIHGGSPHNGGSCQASLSLDRGKTWKVIHSWIGGCPLVQERSAFNFTIPSDTPATETAVFAWTWFNKVGNREMYMGCAPIEVTAGSGSESVAFVDRPDMFIANINSCKLQEMKSVKYPDPGPAVDVAEADALSPPESCGGAAAVVASETEPEGRPDWNAGGSDSGKANSRSSSSAGSPAGGAAGTAGPPGLPAVRTSFGPGENSPPGLNVATTYGQGSFFIAAQVILTAFVWLFC